MSDHIEKLRNYLNKQHQNIKFTSEIERHGLLLFLDTNQWFSLQHGLIETLLHRIFRLCFNSKNFHQEIEILRSIFKLRSYTNNFVNQCIKKYLDKLFIKRDLNFMVPEMKLICVSPN